MTARIREFRLRAAQVLLHAFDLRRAIRARLLCEALRLRAELQDKYLYRVFDNVGGTLVLLWRRVLLDELSVFGDVGRLSHLGVPD